MPGKGSSADDQRELARVADEVLPGLIAHFGASALGELEIQRGSWRVRLRRIPNGAAGDPLPAKRAGRIGGGPGQSPATGTIGATPTSTDVAAAAEAREERGRTVVTSPAVGYFQPAADREVGRPIRQGDVVGYVDVLGVRHDVVATVDGVIGRLLADAGQAVEYGQELVRIDRAEAPRQPAPLVEMTA